MNLRKDKFLTPTSEDEFDYLIKEYIKSNDEIMASSKELEVAYTGLMSNIGTLIEATNILISNGVIGDQE